MYNKHCKLYKCDGMEIKNVDYEDVDVGEHNGGHDFDYGLGPKFKGNRKSQRRL